MQCVIKFIFIYSLHISVQFNFFRKKFKISYPSVFILKIKINPNENTPCNCLEGRTTITIDNVDLVDQGKGEVLVEIKATGICHTDNSRYQETQRDCFLPYWATKALMLWSMPVLM